MEREREMHISHQTDNTRPNIWRGEREREMHISHQTDNTRPIIWRERERDAYITPD